MVSLNNSSSQGQYKRVGCASGFEPLSSRITVGGFTVKLHAPLKTLIRRVRLERTHARLEDECSESNRANGGLELAPRDRFVRCANPSQARDRRKRRPALASLAGERPTARFEAESSNSAELTGQ